MIREKGLPREEQSGKRKTRVVEKRGKEGKERRTYREIQP